MATMAELETALRNADAAGDANAARTLANFIIEARKDPSNLIPDVQIPGTYPLRPEPTLGEQVVGAGETALAIGTGATLGTAGMAAGWATETARQILSGQFGTPEAAKLIEESAYRGLQDLTATPQTPTGQRYTENVGEALQQVLPMVPLAGEMAALSAGARAAAPAVATGATRGAEALGLRRTVPAGAPVPAPVPAGPGWQARGPGPGVAAPERPSRPAPAGPEATGVPPGRALTPAQRRAVEIRQDPYNADNAGVKIEGDQAVPDVAAREAMKQGWGSDFVQFVKTFDPEDVKAALKQLNIEKIGQKNLKFRQENVPANVTGDLFLQRLVDIGKLKNEAGKALDKTAQALKGKQVDYGPAFDKFEQQLQDLGVTIRKDGGKLSNADISVGKIKISLRNSRLQGNKPAKALIKEIYDRFSNVDVMDAHALHTAKQWLSDLIWGSSRKPGGLFKGAENAAKDLRHDINQTLRDYSPEYAAANDKWSAARNALEGVRDATKLDVNLDDPLAGRQLGLAARKLQTRYRVSTDLIRSIADAEKVLDDYGIRHEGTIANQVMMTYGLENMFGSPLMGAFKSEIRSAVETGVEASQKASSKHPLDLALELAMAGVKKAKGINKENALLSMERLLKEQRAESKSKALVPTTGKF